MSDWLTDAVLDLRDKGFDDYEIQLRMGLITTEFNLVLQHARGYSTVITDTVEQDRNKKEKQEKNQEPWEKR